MNTDMLISGNSGQYICGWRQVGFGGYKEVVLYRPRRVLGFLWRPRLNNDGALYTNGIDTERMTPEECESWFIKEINRHEKYADAWNARQASP